MKEYLGQVSKQFIPPRPQVQAIIIHAHPSPQAVLLNNENRTPTTGENSFFVVPKTRANRRLGPIIQPNVSNFWKLIKNNDIANKRFWIQTKNVLLYYLRNIKFAFISTEEIAGIYSNEVWRNPSISWCI